MKNIFSDIIKRKKFQNKFFILGENNLKYIDVKNRTLSIMKKIKNNKIKNRRIGLYLDQGSYYGISILSVVNSNNVVVLLSKDWTNSEIKKIINHCEIDYIISDTNKVKFKGKKIINLDDSLFLFKTSIKSKIFSASNDAVIIYSSGTTGDPKGILLTKKSISHNVVSVCTYLKLNSNDKSLISTPTCYAFSLSQTLTHLYSGASLLPIKTGLMFPSEILNNIIKYNLTGVTGPPTTFRILINSNFKKLKLMSVRYCQVGGTPFELDLKKKINLYFPNAKILNVYGCSENSPRVSYFYLNKNGLSKNNYFSVGKNVKFTKIEVLNKFNRNCKINEVGEIVISGKCLMKKYWKNNELTKKRLKNGKFYTGDNGYLNKYGLLFIAGRKDTIINVGNEKVSPEEVEDVLNTHKFIKESYVYSEKNKLTGSIVIAEIVTNKKIEDFEVQKFCRKYLSSYKIPRKIYNVEKIPKNLYGKIQRRK